MRVFKVTRHKHWIDKSKTESFFAKVIIDCWLRFANSLWCTILALPKFDFNVLHLFSIVIPLETIIQIVINTVKFVNAVLFDFILVNEIEIIFALTEFKSFLILYSIRSFNCLVDKINSKIANSRIKLFWQTKCEVEPRFFWIKRNIFFWESNQRILSNLGIVTGDHVSETDNCISYHDYPYS